MEPGAECGTVTSRMPQGPAVGFNPTPSSAKIFIVEDELVFAEDLREILEGHGYQVCGSVPTGETALTEIPKAAPDIILVDIVLAGKMSGIALAEALSESCDIPVIYLTSNIEDETIVKAKSTHPYGYIPKPFDERVLFSTIEIALFKHQADRKIRESEARYRTFVENIQGIAYRYSHSQTLEFFHGAIEKITGYPASEFLSGQRMWADIVYPEDRETARTPDTGTILFPADSKSREYRIVRKDGGIRWIHDQTRAATDAPGCAPVYEGVIYDITPLKILEADLRKACDIRTLILLMSGHFFRLYVRKRSSYSVAEDQRALFSTISEIFEGIGFEMGIHFISLYQRVSVDGAPPRITEELRCINPHHVSPVELPVISGYAYTQQGFARWDDQLLHGYPVFGLMADFPPEEQHFFQNPSVKSLVMVPILCRDRFWGFLQGFYVNENHEWSEYEISSLQIAADVVATILESRSTEDEEGTETAVTVQTGLAAAHQPVTLMDAAVDLVFVSDEKGKILSMNRAARQFFDLDSDSGHNPAYELFGSYLREQFNRDLQNFSPVQTNGEAHELEIPVKGKNFCLDLALSPVPGTPLDRRLFMGIARDITRQKALERTQHEIQRKLRLMQRIFRHDLTNQISAILGYLSLLKKEVPNPAALGFIEKEERIVDSIRKSLAFTRVYENVGDGSGVWLGITDVFSAAWEGLAPGHVQLDLPRVLPEIYVDPLFGNVVFNLLDNSLRHGGKDLSVIRVTARFDGEDLVLLYEDNGFGILPENKEKIFNHGYYVNNGFGLLLSREILSLTGLSIRETGIYGSGARFEITIPKGMWKSRELEKG